MKVVFFGSPADAVPALKVLHGRGHEIAAVYTQPDRPAGRSKEPVPTPVREAAERLGVEARTPKSLRSADVQAELAAQGADVFVVAAYGRLLPPEVMALPRLGVLNIHPSLLPRYRGPSPVATAILEGTPETGVTFMLLDEGMDTGPLLAQSDPVPLDGTERAGELTERLFRLGAGLLPEVLERWSAGDLSPIPQDHSSASVTKLLAREDGEIDWSQPAERIERMIRAYDPWPETHTRWRGKALKVLEGVVLPGNFDEPGRVVASEGHVRISTGDGRLEVTRVQLEGKRAMDAAEFLRGHGEIEDAVLPS